MQETRLLHELVLDRARDDARVALTCGAEHVSYSALAGRVRDFAAGLVRDGLRRSERVAIWLDKRFEFVIAAFGTTAAGGTFVPVNPLLKAEQVGYILRDCNVRALVTSPERLALLDSEVAQCPDLRRVIVCGEAPAAAQPAVDVVAWDAFHAHVHGVAAPRLIDADMAAILYTSGSTGRPKGVVLSHRNMVAGAKSVAEYLGNHGDDVLLAALPLSFDAGFSQLTTAFHAGARVVLLNYLMPRDVLGALARERVTGLTAVPPLWIQLTQVGRWPDAIAHSLRYFANTGGRMPLETLRQLRARLPEARPFLMYGLTEAFRATYLPPEQVDRRPDSIGQAIPNSEVLVLREDGTPCAPNEPGELVQRGALVAMGYWNDPEKTAERFRPLPGRESGLVLPEVAVFSGDTVRMDDEGYLYFIGRRDEMIKTSGYRVSPTEVEEVAYAAKLVAEVAAVGVDHPLFGQAVVLVTYSPDNGEAVSEQLLAHCKVQLPAFIVPARIVARHEPLPRNANGKIDRKRLGGELADLFDAPHG